MSYFIYTYYGLKDKLIINELYSVSLNLSLVRFSHLPLSWILNKVYSNVIPRNYIILSFHKMLGLMLIILDPTENECHLVE